MGKVTPENECDICKKKLAPYYSTVWYIHYCSDECFEQFIEGYNREIDEIAIEMKTVNQLLEEGKEDDKQS